MQINFKFFKRRVTPFILTFSMLTTLVGCSTNDNKSGNSEYTITTNNTTNEKLLNPLKKAGFNITEILVQDNFPMYKLENNIPEYYTSVKPASDGSNIYNIYQSISFGKCCTVSEFKNYINTSNVTWDTVRKTLNNNTNIEDNIKTIVLNGINNLETNNFNIDLTVLNYNLTQLKLKYIAKDTELPVDVKAKFEVEEHTIYINSYSVNDPLFNDIVIHEILGHGTNIAYLENDGGIYCSTTLNNAMIENQGVLLGTVVIGKAFEEGLAEYIRYMATNKKIEVDDASYSVPLYFLLMMCKSSNTSLVDYTNNGVLGLIKNLEKEKLGRVSHFIELLDIKFNYVSLSNMDVDWEYNDLMYQYLMIYATKEYNEGLDKNKVIEDLNKVSDSYKMYLNTINVDGINVVYTPKANGDICFLTIDYIKEQVIEYVNYAYDNNKVISLK